MTVRKLMLATSSCLVMGALLAPSVVAQDSDTIETVVVTGIRGSLEKSATIKRDSKQIVDVITAEDVGKLPDNNVVEALARVTGVQITREHGEGSAVTIRGMSTAGDNTTLVQTTLNGNSASSGESRAMNLSDIPAELLKSVTVYKSRTADQVEGGIAGTVNVDLRRPLDLPDGWTVAGSVREVNSSIGNTWSPYASLLVANRTMTAIGELGFLLNVSFTQNNYNENYFYNESPQSYWGTTGKAYLATLSSKSVVPYASYYGLEQGNTNRPSVNLSTQWRYSDQLDFVLEGSYMSSKDKTHLDRFKLYNDADSFTLSNVTYGSDGQTVQSMTISNANAPVPVEVQSYLNRNNTDDFHTNFEMHWHDGRLSVDGAVQYNWSSYKYNGFYTLLRFNDAHEVSVDYNSDKAQGGPYFTIPDVDLTDASDYSLFQYHEEIQHSKTQEIGGQLDATYRVSDDWVLRNAKVGVRYSDRHTTRDYGYRDANFFSSSAKSSYMALSDAPCGDDLVTVHPTGMKGAPTWYRVSTSCQEKNMNTMHQFITSGGSSGLVDLNRNDWTTAEPPENSLTQVYVAHEFSFAGYAMVDWAVSDLYFPIDGNAGVRVVNSWGDINSTNYKHETDKTTNETITTLVPHTAKKDYVDVLPSGSLSLHLTDKLQWRFAYTFLVERPSFLDASSWVDYTVGQTNIYAGNPTLKPMREQNYDTSIEYFFGKGGQISAGYFLKKPHGWIYYEGASVKYGEGYCTNVAGCTLYTNRNAPNGSFEGLEFTAQSFFDFLPGYWANFGASVNATLMTQFMVKYQYLQDVEGLKNIYAAAGTSRYTYNLALYYDTPEFSARVSYNKRARWRESVYSDLPGYSPWNDPTSRLDAAVNWTPYKWVTFSMEGSNLLKETNHSFWGKEKYLPESTRMQARTIQLSARFRY